MAKKKNITQNLLIEWYMDEVLSEKEPITSVYAFAKKYNFDESKFYVHFSGFDHLEKSIFGIFGTKTLELISNDEDFYGADAKYQLLSFYYTFFELLTANRSFVTLKLKNNSNKLDSLKTLSTLKDVFTSFIIALEIKKLDLKNETLNKIQNKGFKESAWAQLLFTIQFWLNDNSSNFEKTDLLIEKSIRAAFDLAEATPLNSVFDFAKFIYKENIKL